MARSGISFPSKPMAIRKSVWTSGVSILSIGASSSDLAIDVTNPNPSGTPDTANILSSASNQNINFSFTLNTINITPKIRKHFTVFRDSNAPVGTNFILRDIARLPFNSDLNGYVIRFRVVSTDKNRTSAWSPFYTVKIPDSAISLNKAASANNITYLMNVDYLYSISNYGNFDLINITWDQIDGIDYVDIYEEVKTKNSSWPVNQNKWKYLGRQSSNQISNIFQIKKSHQNIQSYDYRYSFHRYQSDPFKNLYTELISATNETAKVAHESDIYQSRIFIAIQS